MGQYGWHLGRLGVLEVDSVDGTALTYKSMSALVKTEVLDCEWMWHWLTFRSSSPRNGMFCKLCFCDIRMLRKCIRSKGNGKVSISTLACSDGQAYMNC